MTVSYTEPFFPPFVSNIWLDIALYLLLSFFGLLNLSFQLKVLSFPGIPAPPPPLKCASSPPSREREREFIHVLAQDQNCLGNLRLIAEDQPNPKGISEFCFCFVLFFFLWWRGLIHVIHIICNPTKGQLWTKIWAVVATPVHTYLWMETHHFKP